MNVFAPEYFSKFKCSADKCSHSCCIGWEIDIDRDSLDFYKSLKTPFGQKILDGISEHDTPHFILNSNERCPFLNKNGLCDIIINLGDGALCQICSDHPRFRNFFSSREEVGLGLCCEAAANLIVNYEPKVVLTQIRTADNAETQTPEEYEFFRLRNTTTDILQDRTLPFENRLENLMDFIGIKPIKSTQELAEIFKNLEYMETNLYELISECDIPDFTEYDTAFEQLAVYFIYRHLADGLYEGDYYERISFCVMSIRMIQLLCASHIRKHGTINKETLSDIARIYSAEIEYSEDNVQAVLNSIANCG